MRPYNHELHGMPYVKEMQKLDEGVHVARELVYKQLVEIAELRDSKDKDSHLIKKQRKLIDEMMVAINNQDDELGRTLILIVIAWAYAFFSAAWCV